MNEQPKCIFEHNEWGRATCIICGSGEHYGPDRKPPCKTPILIELDVNQANKVLEQLDCYELHQIIPMVTGTSTEVIYGENSGNLSRITTKSHLIYVLKLKSSEVNEE